MHGSIGLIIASMLVEPVSPIATPANPTPIRTAVVATQDADPWPGRPNPPLYRGNPRGYTVGLFVDFGTERFLMAGGAVTMEIATIDTTMVADLRGLEASVRINGSPVPSGLEIEGDPAAGQQRVTLRLPKGESTAAISTRASWPAIAFDIVVDEKAAAQVTWPREWPDSVRPYLAASDLIQSDDEIFKTFIERTTEGRLRRTPIYVAAKELVRSTILEFRNVEGSSLRREGDGRIVGFQLQGAAAATSAVQVTPADMVCTCVAVLRAAGIPARPVIGIHSGDGDAKDSKRPKGRRTFCCWAEFHLPGAGWVPFDPFEMRGQGLRQADIARPWRWFGSIDSMNRRVGIAYDFAPFNQGRVLGYPAGWVYRLESSDPIIGFGLPITSIQMIGRGPVRP
ncbi:MAG: transglutaminase domain-containing protein [Phycisphaeraceae bacterium]|nr:transglutaminase domain-containing protein [Phycisphaeraceae bacterium]